MKIDDAMRQAFKELLALSPVDLNKRLKDKSVGPIGKLYRALGYFEFENKCSGCDYYCTHPKCSLPSSTPCPRVDRDKNV